MKEDVNHSFYQMDSIGFCGKRQFVWLMILCSEMSVLEDAHVNKRDTSQTSFIMAANQLIPSFV